MGRKRKRSNVVRHSRYSLKRRKRNFRLTDLPPELLDMVLEYAVPDSRDLKLFLKPRSTAIMYTSPIMQVSRSLRERCFDIINRRCVWMRLKFPTEDFFLDYEYAAGEMPKVPPAFRYLIPENAPRVSLEFHERGLPVRRTTRSSNLNTIVFAFNFANLIHLCEIMNEPVEDQTFTSVLLRYENMTHHTWQAVSDIIAPALSQLRGLEVIGFEPPIANVDHNPWSCMPTGEPMDLLEAYEKAAYVWLRANRMNQKGYSFEADLFLLYNACLIDEVTGVLPCPSDWALGDVNPWLFEHEGKRVSYPGRCARGNQLRSFLFQIQEMACHGYIRLLVKYHTTWCSRHTWYDDIARLLTQQPQCSWFGLDDGERARFHHIRALFWNAKCDLEFAGYIAPVDPYYQACLEAATKQMYFAHMLLPDDQALQRQYENLVSRFGKKRKRELLAEFESLYTTIKTPADGLNTSSIEWTGDIDMLDGWGGPRVLWWFPLTQNFEVDADYERDELRERCRRAAGETTVRSAPVYI